MICCKNTNDNVKKRQETQQSDKKRSIGIFHKKVNGRCNIEPKISIDLSLIKNISTSWQDGTTLLTTSDGIIAVKESFEEANKIWENS